MAIGVAMALAVAGCTAFGMCGPTDAAQWVQPGLYAALDELEDVTRRSHPHGIELDETLRAYYGETATFEGVHYFASVPTQTDPGAPIYQASLAAWWASPEFHLTLTLPTNASEDEARGLYRAFIRNVSANEAKWGQWEDDLARQWGEDPAAPAPGEPQRAYPQGAVARSVSTRIEGPFRVAAFLRELDIAPASSTPLLMPGEAHPAQGPWGPWKFDIRLPVIEHEQDVPEGRMRLTVDTLDQTFGSIEYKIESNHTATEARIKERMQTAGLASPPLNETSFHTMVC